MTVVSGSHWPNPDRVVCVFDLSLRLFIPRRLVLSHGLGRTHQGRVDLATRSAGESRPQSGAEPCAWAIWSCGDGFATRSAGGDGPDRGLLSPALRVARSTPPWCVRPSPWLRTSRLGVKSLTLCILWSNVHQQSCNLVTHGIWARF